MYGVPIFNITCKTNIQKLQIIQNKILQIILNKKSSTKISELHKIAGEISHTPYITDVIQQATEKFYKQQINKNSLTKHIELFNKDNAPFKIKHSLPHSKVQINN